jgi:decaprenyl-phosphate phosphoribosyltransferase
MASEQSGPAAASAGARGVDAAALLRLARPKQWTKSGFVLIGPLYALRDQDLPLAAIVAALLAAVAFALASSGCYVFNDLADIEADRRHPRKSRRPLAAGLVTPAQARAFGVALLAVSVGAALLVVPLTAPLPALAVLLLLGVYIGNVFLYSGFLKRIVVADVLSLSLGFVLRVMAGCAAAAVGPSTWLLNVTLFLAMFLAFGKRLGERRTVRDGDAGAVRGVLARYSDDLLRMAVVVSGVATLVTYAGYVQDRALDYSIDLGFGAVNLLWPTILPATYVLLRSILLIEEGLYDDPTELATRDRPFQAGVAIFGVLTGIALLAATGGAPAG